MGATTTDCTALSQFVTQDAPWGNGRFAVVKLHVDLADIGADKAYFPDGSAADVHQLWDIPAGCHILSALLDVTEASTVSGTATVALGDATSAAGFLAATDIKTEAQTGTIITDAFGAVGGKMYAATDTLDITFGGNDTSIHDGVFDIYLICCFINN